MLSSCIELPKTLIVSGCLGQPKLPFYLRPRSGRKAILAYPAALKPDYHSHSSHAWGCPALNTILAAIRFLAKLDSLYPLPAGQTRLNQ